MEAFARWFRLFAGFRERPMPEARISRRRLLGSLVNRANPFKSSLSGASTVSGGDYYTVGLGTWFRLYGCAKGVAPERCEVGKTRNRKIWGAGTFVQQPCSFVPCEEWAR
jgi:hypothetical protein